MFITLEGPEGSGKTSQISLLADNLREKGHDIVLTREPGGTEIGNQIRQVIMDLKNTEMHPISEILLFQASRAQLVNQVIRPALREGKIVLCDRYADSTLAYQGYGHQTDLNTLTQIIEFATGGLKPDFTVLLDIDSEEGLKRRSGDDEHWNRMDAYEMAFHQRVREGYHQLLAAEPGRWEKIDAGKLIPEVQIDLQAVILERISAFVKTV
ncbi:MAG: dTMP kinase [Chloroflexota bacterium]